jgi:protein-disulfide isomerase
VSSPPISDLARPADGDDDEHDEAQEQSSARLHLTVLALAGIAVLAAALVAAFATKSTPQLTPGKAVPGETKTFALLTGVPQHGFALGDTHAPVTLIEYADLRCGACAEFSNDVLPDLVRGYVDSGELRIVFRPLDVNGQDSVAAARVAAALAQQNVLWQFAGLVYHNQQSGAFVTETYIAAVIETIAGADLAEALTAREKTKVAAEIARFAAQARRLHLRAEPSFLLSRTGSRGRAFKPSSIVDSGSFGEEIESLLPH